MANRRWDVVVVGARVSGAATAMLLGRAGLRVLCVDRSRSGSDTVSTHALMRGGVLQLHRWGVLDDVKAVGTPGVRRTVFHYGQETIAITLKPSDGVEALYAPRRTVLDALLVDHARRAGVVFAFGGQVTRLHRDASGAVAGVVVADSRRSTSWSAVAPLVIGADGRESIIASSVGARVTTAANNASALLYGYFAGMPSDGYEWFYDEGVSGGVIPTNDGLSCVFVATAPSLLDAAVRLAPPAAVFDRLSCAVGLGSRLAGAQRIGQLRSVRGLPAGYLRSAHGPGWALVGDAGHWLDPLSTHGMTGALRDAGLLADAVVSASPRSPGLTDALEHYEAVRDRLSMPMIDVTDELAGFTWDPTDVRTLLRRLASCMADEVELLMSRTASG